jgi:arsenate reductase-like glutaredoxin family protein
MSLFAIPARKMSKKTKSWFDTDFCDLIQRTLMLLCEPIVCKVKIILCGYSVESKLWKSVKRRERSRQ